MCQPEKQKTGLLLVQDVLSVKLGMAAKACNLQRGRKITTSLGYMFYSRAL
ncbi:hypothetical protein I79_006362 [Cricetulus griseus]|uniref:Uncharacterized protein n=1 Tax=Cricetulus griseus TaxID=10029 RepID=G3H7M7_CRIGR|nr:hypothetical protein I79_006362 [Cricetulus griseus]